MENENLSKTPEVPVVKPTNQGSGKVAGLILVIILLIIASGVLIFQNIQLQKQLAGMKVATTSLSPVAYVSPSSTPQIDTSSWKIYTNTNSTHNYSIKYPSDWSFREVSNIKGAAFYRTVDGDKIGNKPIVVGIYPRGTSDNSILFPDYVKVAAIHEIQGFQSLASIKAVTTDSGLVGYETTWNQVDPLGQNQHESGPITYFPVPTDNSDDFEVSLGSQNFSDIYQQVIKTFQITPVN